MTRKTALPLVTLLLCTACASIPQDEAALLTGEIQCSRADSRIAALQAARPGDFRKARVLASSLTPGGLALGIASGDMADRQHILSGRYATSLNSRIEEIRDACGLGAA